ncbi:MAG TPA: FAD-dependent oxidoreductase [Ktedonobacteraceae bacterium]|nr:FAD-dependent oxidoreductase [Ktedonobacteraceae bacterium]
MGGPLKSIAIIGAGCSGLAAAHELHNAGYSVTVFEKQSEVGGRAATRKRDGFIFDYGAQYIKGDDPASVSAFLITERFRLADLIDIGKPVWVFDRQGHIQEGDPLQNREPKWTYRSGLNSLAKRMAEGLFVRLETPAGHLLQHTAGWSLFDEAGQYAGDFAQVFITIPASQAVDLIEASQIDNGRRENICALLRQARYNPLISVTLGYQPAPQARPYYALVNTDKAHDISWLAWEHEKAPERVPEHAGLLIAQMSPHFSLEHWRTPNEEVISEVAKHVAALLGEPLIRPVFTDIHRWRYALPLEKADAQLLNSMTMPQGLAFCGDAFVGGRVHLALEHGVTVARQLIKSMAG